MPKEGEELKNIYIYTDGCCLGNPGKGGYGAILVYENKEKTIGQGYRKTTNNRMEMLACIEALKLLKVESEVELCSDSKYIVDGVNKGWAEKWQKNNWMRNKKDKAENIDLWTDLLKLNSKHIIKWVWVKGHSGHIYNERCDKIAKKYAESSSLLIDSNYENKDK
jgi:ribonuclease HI